MDSRGHDPEIYPHSKVLELLWRNLRLADECKDMLTTVNKCLDIWSVFLHPFPHIVRRDALVVVRDRIITSSAMRGEGVQILLGRSAGDGSFDKSLQR